MGSGCEDLSSLANATITECNTTKEIAMHLADCRCIFACKLSLNKLNIQIFFNTVKFGLPLRKGLNAIWAAIPFKEATCKDKMY